MDVVVGVAVTGRVARLAMVGSPASGGQVFDQYALDLPDDAMTDLADTIVGTYRAVAESGNHVAATRLCLPDASQAEILRQTVSSAGVQNVEVVSEAEAAVALARSAGADAALLLADDDTVSLTALGEDEESTSVLASVPIGAAGAAVACAAVLQQMPDPAATRIMLVGQRLDLDSIAAELRSTAPVEAPPDAGYAIARGAAQTVEDTGFPAGAATQMAPAAADADDDGSGGGDPAAVGPQLAYSQEEPDYYEMPAESLEEFVPEQDNEAPYTAVIAPPPPRMLLIGSALGFVLASFAMLAVTVAITIRPTAAVEAQPAPTEQSDTVPGRYLPPVPHEPDPVALPIAVVSPAPAAPAPPSAPTDRGPVHNAPAPAPEAPPPGPPPAPQVPVVPPVVIPPWNPFPTLTTTTTSPTTTTTTTYDHDDADDHHDDHDNHHDDAAHDHDAADDDNAAHDNDAADDHDAAAHIDPAAHDDSDVDRHEHAASRTAAVARGNPGAGVHAACACACACTSSGDRNTSPGDYGGTVVR